jgi:hypothetical protein
MTLVVEYPLTSATGTGSATDFVVGFSCEVDADLVVTTTTGGGSPVTQSLGTAYVVTGDLPAGAGHVVFQSGHVPAAGVVVTITRDTPAEQPLTFGDLATFTPSLVGKALDRLWRKAQELERDLGTGGGGGGGPAAWADITGKPSTFPPSTHSHAIADVTGLQAALDGKQAAGSYAAASHSHATADVTSLQEYIEDTVAAELVAGTNITLAYDDPTGKLTISAAGGGSGEANTASNVGTAGVGVFKAKTGVDLAFKKVAAASSKLTVTDNTGASQVDLDVVEANLTLGNLGGTLGVAKGGTGSTTAAAARTALGLAIGTDVQAQNANLAALAGLTGSLGKIPRFTGAGAMGLIDAPAGTMANLVATFGGVADGVTSNDAAFTAAEASAYERIWLPEGSYMTSLVTSSFNKWYEGPGVILIGSGAGVLSGIRAAAPAGTLSFGAITSEYGESGDVKFTDMRYEILRTGRENLANHYFQAGANARFTRFTNKSGGSGTLAHLAASAGIGATTATLNSVDGVSVGMVLGFQLDDNATPLDTVTVSAVNTSTKVITFSPALANAYTVSGTDYFPPYLSGYAHSPQVTNARRTMNTHQMVVLSHQAAGDCYAWLARVSADYIPKAGQTHFFDRSTVGIIGGDLVGTQDGNYVSAIEFGFTDNGKSIAAIGKISSYARTNDADVFGVTWVHDLPKSEGSKPIDVFYHPSGLARVGLDLTSGDFSSDGQRAIQMKSTQRLYFDASASATLGTRARGFWGNVQGDSYLTHDTDGSGEFVDLWVGGTRVQRNRPGSFNIAQPANFASSVNASGALVTGSSLTAASHLITTGGSVAIPRNSAVYLDGLGAPTYFAFDGTTIYLFKNGSLVASW